MRTILKNKKINAYRFKLIFLLLFSYSINVHSTEQIGAIGHLVPASEIIDLSASNQAAIHKVLVKPGQSVKKGDVLVVFNNDDLLRTQLNLSLLNQKEQQQSLKASIDSQNYSQEKLILEQQRAEKDLARYDRLGKHSTTRKEKLRLERVLEDIQLSLLQSNSQLKHLNNQLVLSQEIHKNNINLARSKLNLSTLKAPIDGVILEVNRQIGEFAAGSAIIKMADISKMYVRSEIYEGDLLKIKIGMAAKISSQSLPKELNGTVKEIGRIVSSRNRLAIVLIELEEADIASKLIGMEVQTTISF